MGASVYPSGGLKYFGDVLVTFLIMADVSRSSDRISASDSFKKFRWLHECDPIVCFRAILLAIFLFSSHSARIVRG